LYRSQQSDSSEECTIVDSGSDEELFTSKSKAPKSHQSSTVTTAFKSSSTSGGGLARGKSVKKGVNFDSDEDDNDEDEFDRGIPQRKRWL
jgi:hypothetical protein